MKESATTLDGLRKSLPPMVARHDIENYLGGIVSRGHLQNLDSQGKGPKKVRIGKKIGYLREDLVDWLIARSTEQ